MNIDHIFIFTNDMGKIADSLVNFGLSEGSSRVHIGQGTTNRKFYFSNFFLEVLWVHDDSELISPVTKSTGLWQRAAFEDNGISPYGLCLVNNSDTDGLFEAAYKYQPNYFPEGMNIEILKNENQTHLPWTFRLPFKGQKKYPDEPTNHKNGICTLTKAIFEYIEKEDDQYLGHFTDCEQIKFQQSERNWLTLVFDKNNQGKEKIFEQLCLSVRY